MFDLAEGDDAAELGGERLVVGEEKHALAVALAGVAEGEFEGMPSFSGAGATANEELPIFRKLIKQGKAGGELPFEKLLCVINEGALFFWESPLPKGFQNSALLKRID